MSRYVRSARVVWILGCAMLLPAGQPMASGPEFVDPNPAPGNQFGAVVVPLSTGNVVVTSPNDDAGGVNAGAVYLFDGTTGALISTLRGSASNDQVGSGGVTALANGNFVVSSPWWHNAGVVGAGAATWGSGTNGVNGPVSAANSLVGSTADDHVGDHPGVVVALTNGNYVVLSYYWDNGGAFDAGAATWGSGTTGVSGAISAANSLVGSTAGDNVGSGAVELTNGNYVVPSPTWDNGGIVEAGAVTWGNGTTGVTGVVNAANSLVGSTAEDYVGFGGVTALSNGNYVVPSFGWDNGAIVDAGAVTWGSGTAGVTGAVTTTNSLVGSKAGDKVGLRVTALSNGNYVVSSPFWDYGAIADAGAATWGSGTSGVTGEIIPANSLVGSTASDQIGGATYGGVTALTNGNYVVRSPLWDNGAIVNAGAATWGSGMSGVTGAISAANSLVGSAADDQVAFDGVTALSNGNYVVASGSWDNGAVANAGASTWGSGASGVSGAISVANSLVGSAANNAVGLGGATALSNGNYVVRSPAWDNGGVVNVGAVTWGSGATGITGVVSTTNSLVGSKASDGVGVVAALSNGNYVVRSSFWDNGAVVDAGAVTWGSGTGGVTGVVSTTNSLVGSAANDRVGLGVTALSNGNYVVASSSWDNGGVADAGAATWGNGATGVSGAVSAANSLVGSTAQDQVGFGVTALSNGNYVVTNPLWNNGALADAGAATWGSGATGVSGVVSSANSLVGSASNTSLASAVEDVAHDAFVSSFPAEGGGRVRIGPVETSPSISSAADVPGDQGGWLRLTILRSDLDHVGAAPPVAQYGVWRRVPGTMASRGVEPTMGATLGSRADSAHAGRLRALLGACDTWEAGGRLFVTMCAPRPAEMTAAFPPGTWELVANIPAVQQAQYVVAVPTISNAAPNDFVTTAHTTTPSVWYISAPVSAQSMDNLAPAQPARFTAAYANGQTNLSWTANLEPDLDTYSLYRGTSADFIPSIGNRIASQTDTSYADVGPAGSYYKLSAVDVNGNESTFALMTPEQTTSVKGGTPVAFALEGVRPNPAAGHDFRVAFALPSGASAWLELLDVSGRRVLSREVGSLGAGRHAMNLADGRRVATGIYWVRLIQGRSHRTTRAVVLD